MPQIISANRLNDGIIVFRSKDGLWSEAFSAAEVLQGGANLESALAAAQSAVIACEVLEVAPIEVVQEKDQWRAAHIRDSIRINGPTISAGPKTGSEPGQSSGQKSSQGSSQETPDVSI